MDRLKQQVKEAADVDVTNDTEFKPLVDAFENGKEIKLKRKFVGTISTFPHFHRQNKSC